MLLRELKVWDRFNFVGSDIPYECRGNGWYASIEGYDGGPWSKDESDNPEVELIETTLKLRLIADTNDIPLLTRPVVFIGYIADCKAYAESLGYHWHSDRNMLFDGYYVNDAGNCLMPT